MYIRAQKGFQTGRGIDMIEVTREKDGSKFEPYNIVIRIETMTDCVELGNELRLLHNAMASHQEGRADHIMTQTVMGRIYLLLQGD